MIGIPPWYEQYLFNRTHLYYVPLIDSEAYKRYPEYRWVYDKHLLYKNLGYESIVHPFIKPRFNFHGMGKDSEAKSKNFVAHPFLEGNHYSIDMSVKKGKIISYFAFKAHKEKLTGSFIMLESANIGIPFEVRKLLFLLGNYSGFLNVELIGTDIIEAHLRPSLQFADISGGFLDLVPTVFEKTYSVIYRIPKDLGYTMCYITKERSKIAYKVKELVNSFQLTFKNKVPFSEEDNDSETYRYLVINGKNLRNISKASDIIHKHLKFE